MQARDIMQTHLITVAPDTGIHEIAEILMASRISAVPVVDEEGHPLGIVSEGDLMRRPETETERRPSWWLSLMASPQEQAFSYIKSHGGHARDVMTRDLVTVEETASLEEIAETLEKHHIKRVPVLREGVLVGIVSRADLLRGLVARRAEAAPDAASDASDREIRAAIEKEFKAAGVRRDLINPVVSGGVVQLWGVAETEEERQAAAVAAENVPGIRAIENNIGVLSQAVRSVLWAE